MCCSEAAYHCGFSVARLGQSKTCSSEREGTFVPIFRAGKSEKQHSVGLPGHCLASLVSSIPSLSVAQLPAVYLLEGASSESKKVRTYAGGMLQPADTLFWGETCLESNIILISVYVGQAHSCCLQPCVSDRQLRRLRNRIRRRKRRRRRKRSRPSASRWIRQSIWRWSTTVS